MYLEVMPNGSKYWRLKFRFAGKEKRLGLGVYPKMSLADARKGRDKTKDFLREGKDPSEEMSKKALKTANMASADNSLESVAREWFGMRTHIWVPIGNSMNCRSY